MMGMASLASQRGEGIRFPFILLGVSKAASMRGSKAANMKNSESWESRLLRNKDPEVRERATHNASLRGAAFAERVTGFEPVCTALQAAA